MCSVKWARPCRWSGSSRLPTRTWGQDSSSSSSTQGGWAGSACVPFSELQKQQQQHGKTSCRQLALGEDVVL